ncbi:DUF1194 domain-containing protein [Rhizobium sullae]|uniref:DUF1194 domain-containing protein n=1 Tax=Rhizobium sullae TaxID=50338 RepID=UPI00104FD4C6|nr:DUF1194 domain-containing protein [Rhizobium sullae]
MQRPIFCGLRHCGPGSFVVPVHKPEDFVIAVRRKLLLEVSGVTPAPSVYFSDVARRSTANGCSRDASTRSILEFDRQSG